MVTISGSPWLTRGGGAYSQLHDQVEVVGAFVNVFQGHNVLVLYSGRKKSGQRLHILTLFYPITQKTFFKNWTLTEINKPLLKGTSAPTVGITAPSPVP